MNQVEVDNAEASEILDAGSLSIFFGIGKPPSIDKGSFIGALMSGGGPVRGVSKVLSPLPSK
mgnify:CR=1 FL=1